MRVTTLCLAAIGFVGTTASASAARADAPTGLTLGWLHSCEFEGPGSARCTGYNRYGQIGDGSTTDRLLPVSVGLTGVQSMSGGFTHTCAAKSDGTLYCWGDNRVGALGDGTRTNRSAPTQVSISGVVEVASGNSHTCALKLDGSVWCWGSNYTGQLGAGGSTADILTTPQKVVGISDAVSISGLSNHVCVLHADSTVSCWGDNYGGQLGDGTYDDRPTPQKVPGLSGVVQIETGGAHTCALLDDQSVSCWGYNYWGQLGDGVVFHDKVVYMCGGTIFDPRECTQRVDIGEFSNPTPQPVIQLFDAVSLSLGSGHSCALLTDGTVECWGANSLGQLGDGSVVQRSVPAPVLLPPVVELEVGGSHGCARTTLGEALCWGSNNSGEAGDGSKGQLRFGTYYFDTVPGPSEL